MKLLTRITFSSIVLIAITINQNFALSPDSTLQELGLSPKYFRLTTVKEAGNHVFRNLSNDLIKPNDTIIVLNVDTLQSPLVIENKEIKYRLVLSGKVFNGNLSFNNSKFKLDVYMNECTFIGTVDLSNSIFDSTLILWSTKFYKTSNFSYATINDVQFMNTTFYDAAQFYKTIFDNGTYFITTQFKKSVTFNNALFNDYTRFSGCEFNERVFFWESSFLDTVSFESVKLTNGIDFILTKFNRLLSLRNLISEGTVDFYDTQMPQYIDLSGIQLKQPLDFYYIKDTLLNDGIKININRVDLDKVFLTEDFSLYFDEELTIDRKNSIYKKLLDNLNSRGFKNLYKTFDIEYAEFVNNNYNNFGQKIGYYINKLWWGLGYNKQRVFIWTIVFIILFSIPIYTNFNLFVKNVYPFTKLSKRFTDNRSYTNAFKKGVLDYITAVFYTIYVFFNFKLDFGKLSFDNYWSGIFIIVIYTIGLICTAFIINLIITT